MARIEPKALVECGNDLVAGERWSQAYAMYEELTGRYPGHALAADAERGKRKAELGIQLDEVSGLLEPAESGGQPAYCAKPAPYEGAARYRGKGPHRALLFGQNGHRKKLPSSWLAKGASDAVLVICAGESAYGAKVRTCRYKAEAELVLQQPGVPKGFFDVTFRKRKIPVRVYEVHTGRLVTKTSVQIGGRSCPRRFNYTVYNFFNAPPDEAYVTSSTSDIRGVPAADQAMTGGAATVTRMASMRASRAASRACW